jgi:hypothetical protein
MPGQKGWQRLVHLVLENGGGLLGEEEEVFFLDYVAWNDFSFGLLGFCFLARKIKLSGLEQKFFWHFSCYFKSKNPAAAADRCHPFRQ